MDSISDVTIPNTMASAVNEYQWSFVTETMSIGEVIGVETPDMSP